MYHNNDNNNENNDNNNDNNNDKIFSSKKEMKEYEKNEINEWINNFNYTMNQISCKSNE